MAESRRVQLTTLSSDSPAPPEQTSSPQKPPSSAGQAEGDPLDPPAKTHTVRLDIPLFEPDERNFPEFSYSQLVEIKINHSKEEEEETEENDEVAAIARKLEEKYSGKSKKKDRIQDLIDIGYGYDDEDSFIDNSEAYDEFVPASITTKFGGFYVNSGVLQFRQASDTEADTKDFTAEEETLDRSKKRKLNGRQDKPKKKLCRESKEMQNTMGSKSSTLSVTGPNEELKKKKKKKAVSTLSVTSMLKKFQREKDRERQKMETENRMAASIRDVSTVVLSPADAAGGGGLALSDPLLSLIGSTNDHTLIQAASTVDFDIDLDSLLEVTEETLVPKPVPQPSTETELTDDQNPITISDKAQTQISKNFTQIKSHQEQTQLLPQAAAPQPCVPFPEGLPPGLEGGVRRLMVAAKTSEGESKLKFFSPDINSILLDIELQCREQGAQTRSRVYTHLASFLPCSRDTLLKRVKKLLVTHMAEAPDAQEPILKLKQAINRAMPQQLECYHESCRAFEQVKLSKATDKRENGLTEDSVEEKGAKKGGPKKLFKWNQEIRECLDHVLRPRMEKCTKERKGIQEVEEYLKNFLDNEVKSLWPKGWMQSRVLMRESRNLLGLFPSLPVKKVRPEKKQSGVLQATQLKGEPHETDGSISEGLEILTCPSLSSVRKEDAALKTGDSIKAQLTVDPGASAAVGSAKHLVTVASAPAHSLLDLLADQALSQVQSLPVPQELLTAALAKYKHSLQHLGFGVDTRSPPLPPPPPQSSPVTFPVTGVCHVVVPQMLQGGDFSKHLDVDHVQIISDDDDITTE